MSFGFREIINKFLLIVYIILIFYNVKMEHLIKSKVAKVGFCVLY